MADTNGSFLNGNSPWWLRAVVQVGVPTVIAMFLMWFITLGPGQKAQVIDTKLDAHIQHTEKLHSTFEEYVRVNTLLMRQMCVSTSKQAGDDPNNCFKP